MFSKNLKYIFLIHCFTSFRLVFFILSKKLTTMSSTATRIPPLLEAATFHFYFLHSEFFQSEVQLCFRFPEEVSYCNESMKVWWKCVDGLGTDLKKSL